jgi:hypothetical protein
MTKFEKSRTPLVLESEVVAFSNILDCMLCFGEIPSWKPFIFGAKWEAGIFSSPVSMELSGPFTILITGFTLISGGICDP